MVCDTGGETIAEYLERLDKGGIMFNNEVVVKNRVGVTFLEEDVLSVGWEEGRENGHY